VGGPEQHVGGELDHRGSLTRGTRPCRHPEPRVGAAKGRIAAVPADACRGGH
jgi:hypothetical protein